MWAPFGLKTLAGSDPCSGVLCAVPSERLGYWGHSPVVPVVTAVTADHGAPIVRLVAPWADPDLIAPLVADLM